MQNDYFAVQLLMAAYNNIVKEKKILSVQFLKIESLWRDVYVNWHTPLDN